MTSLLAKDHDLNLCNAGDAMDVISSGLRGCIFTTDDVCEDFFNLKTGVAGEVFQKFVNYHFRVAFVLADDPGPGDRFTELVREHERHPVIRFFRTIEEAESWLR